jgi:hypothetical protein
MWCMKVWILVLLKVEDLGKRELVDFFYTSKLTYCECGACSVFTISYLTLLFPITHGQCLNIGYA